MFIQNGFLHGVFQGFSQCFIQLFMLELQFFGSVYSQEDLVIAISGKNICNKQLNLLVFPRSLLMFGFNIVIYFCFFCFLIFENHQSKRRGARFNVFRDSQWRYQNYITDIILIYISLTVDMFFSHVPSQSHICFHKHRMCSVVK